MTEIKEQSGRKSASGSMTGAAHGAGRRRNITIDLMRSVFAVVIMIHHSRYVLGDDDCMFLGGSFAVEFFFLVSGYLMMESIARELQRNTLLQTADMANPLSGQEAAGLGTQTLSFLKRKIKAFLPEFTTAWLIGFIVAAAAKTYTGSSLTLGALWGYFKDYFFELVLVRMTGVYTGGVDGATWYLSSMLLCMAILYPLIKRYPDYMGKVGVWLIALLLLGYMCQTDGHPRSPGKWLGYVFKGNLRAMAELCLGIGCWHIEQNLAERRRRANLRRHRKNSAGTRVSSSGELVDENEVLLGMRDYLRSFAVTFMQVVLYWVLIRFMYYKTPGKHDYFYLFLMMVAVMLSFSGQGLLEMRFDSHPAVARTVAAADNVLSKYSTALFFGHIYFAMYMNDFLPAAYNSGHIRMHAYVVLSLVNGVVVMLLAGLIRKKKLYEGLIDRLC